MGINDKIKNIKNHANTTTKKESSPKTVKIKPMKTFISNLKYKRLSNALSVHTSNVKINQINFIEREVTILLENGELKSHIIENDYKNLYKYLSTKSNIYRAKVLDKVAKVSQIPKTAIHKDYEEFIKNKKRDLAKVLKAKELKKFQKLFDTIDTIEIPDNYTIKNQFLQYTIKEDIPPQIICKIFTIGTKILAKDKAYYEIKKVENNYQKTIIATARDLTDAKRVAGLFADTGEIFDSNKANLVTKFISEYTRINEDKIETKIGRTTTGWENDIFYLPQLRNDCVWIDNPSQLEKSFTSKGTLDNQIEMLRELSKGKAFILSLASLSSSLYDIIENINLNYTVHIGGLRGDGKSLAIKTAISLYGSPNISDYGRNWNATLSGIETYVERFKSVPAWCDELEASKSVSDVITFMYAFSEGVGRARAMVKDGEVIDREVKTFKGILFSTGEKNIEEVINSMGKERNIPLGVTRRVLDLKVDTLWTGIDKEKVGDFLDDNHGIFITEWIQIIKQDKELINTNFKSLRKTLNWKLEGKEKLFYLMVTTLQFLTKYKIINDDTYKIQFKYISQMVEQEKIEMSKNKNIAQSFLDHASNFIAENANFFITQTSLDMPNTIYGRINEKTIALTTKVFKQICQENGLVQAQVIDALKKDELLTKANNGTPSKLIKLHKSIVTRCYVINKDAISPQEDYNFPIITE